MTVPIHKGGWLDRQPPARALKEGEKLVKKKRKYRTTDSYQHPASLDGPGADAPGCFCYHKPGIGTETKPGDFEIINCLHISRTERGIMEKMFCCPYFS